MAPVRRSSSALECSRGDDASDHLDRQLAAPTHRRCARPVRRVPSLARNERGFTLIELLVVIIVLGLPTRPTCLLVAWLSSTRWRTVSFTLRSAAHSSTTGG